MKLKGKSLKKYFQVAEAVLNPTITCETNVNKTNGKQDRTFLKPLGLKGKCTDGLAKAQRQEGTQYMGEVEQNWASSTCLG